MEAVVRTIESVSTTPRRDAWYELLEFIPWKLSGTYTFKLQTPMATGVNHYLNYANGNLGGFFSRALIWVATPELTHAGRIHLHALFAGIPDNYAVRHVMETRWKRGMAKVKKLDDVLGALRYALKFTELDSCQPILSRALREELGRNQSHRMLRVE